MGMRRNWLLFVEIGSIIFKHRLQLLTESGVEREMMILSKSPSVSAQQPRDFCTEQPLLAPVLQGRMGKYSSEKRARFA